MTQWFKPLIVIGSLLLPAVEAFSQCDTTELRLRYEQAPRDVAALTAYTQALEKAGDARKSEALVREFMKRCPVTQIADRDTYLLISRYVFEDPYSNASDYALFLLPRMKWDAGELTSAQKAERMKQTLADMRYGVSHGDEVDKRFEVMMQLSRRLDKAVDELCDPVLQQDGSYAMPAFDEAKAQLIRLRLAKANLPGRDAMRTRLKIAEAIHTGQNSKAIQYLCAASDMGIQNINGGYITAVMDILTESEPEPADRSLAIETLERLCGTCGDTGNGGNCYPVLGKLYRQAGETEKAEKCFRAGKAIEDRRQAFYEMMMNAKH